MKEIKLLHLKKTTKWIKKWRKEGAVGAERLTGWWMDGWEGCSLCLLCWFPALFVLFGERSSLQYWGLFTLRGRSLTVKRLFQKLKMRVKQFDWQVFWPITRRTRHTDSAHFRSDEDVTCVSRLFTVTGNGWFCSRPELIELRVKKTPPKI